jgi:hypothetical protein
MTCSPSAYAHHAIVPSSRTKEESVGIPRRLSFSMRQRAVAGQYLADLFSRRREEANGANRLSSGLARLTFDEVEFDCGTAGPDKIKPSTFGRVNNCSLNLMTRRKMAATRRNAERTRKMRGVCKPW